MPKETIDEKSSPLMPKAAVSDCYMELIAYTIYVVEKAGSDSLAYEKVVDVYRDLVARSREYAVSRGFSEETWRDGFFPVCAYIDEALLCSGWEERARWEQDQLQRQYFNTTAMGEQFFERLDALDADNGDIRAVYEFCLALGFKGRYYRSSDAGRLADIQYTQLKSVGADTELRYPQILFPEAYESESSAKTRKRQKWKRATAIFPATIVLPLLIFTALYIIFDRLLDQTLTHYFGAGF